MNRHTVACTAKPTKNPDAANAYGIETIPPPMIVDMSARKAPVIEFLTSSGAFALFV